MLLSRFWFFVLAAATATAASAAVLSVQVFNRQYDAEIADQLRRDRFELELLLRVDARTRIDAIAPIAAHNDVRTALRAASGRRDRTQIDGEARQRVGERLTDLNRQLEEMAGDILFAVDDGGYIVGQLGSSELPAGAGLGGFPLVEKALAGYVRDDVWVWNGEVYRMAARPVIENGQYVGAIVHGMKIDEDLANKLATRLQGATVAFFLRDRVLAAAVPGLQNAPRSEELENQLAAALGDEKLKEGGRTDPLDLNQTGRAVYSLMTGGAAHAQAGYAIARPRMAIASVFQIFETSTTEDRDAMSMELMIVAAAGLLLGLIGLFWVWLERDRPLKRLRAATGSLAKREIDRLTITDFAGPYRRIAEGVNEAMDKAVERAGAQAKRKPADLDEILGPTPAAGGPSYFGFAQKEGAGDADIPSLPPDDLASAPPPAALPAPPPAGGLKPAAPPAMAKPAPPPPKAPAPPGPPPPAPPMAAARPPAAPPAAPPRPAAPPMAALSGNGASDSVTAGGAAAKPEWAKATMMGTGGAPGEGGGPVQAKPAAGAGSPLDNDDDEDGATMVAQVSEELLAATQGSDPDEPHFKETYNNFVETKKQCGEPTAGLTYDKFAQTLRKNREQIISKHGATRVRFTVYVKEGKAALKATPVKD